MYWRRDCADSSQVLLVVGGIAPAGQSWSKSIFFASLIAFEQTVRAQGFEQVARGAFVDTELTRQFGDRHWPASRLQHFEQPGCAIYGRDQAGERGVF